MDKTVTFLLTKATQSIAFEKYSKTSMFYFYFYIKKMRISSSRLGFLTFLQSVSSYSCSSLHTSSPTSVYKLLLKIVLLNNFYRLKKITQSNTEKTTFIFLIASR
ncbi:hypothetical protein V8G54_034518 [Vigna mungo]|uniref:Uncharacterized protein n=1 Tax=Vigna mungo TaxID=3915 RepID=A0AAQ3MQY6_VIGMU